MSSQYTYLIILLVSLVGPLSLSFDKKVAFHKEWKYLFPAMLPAAIFYIIWDIYFTEKNVWSFNEAYILGPKFYGLPLEEVAFFFVVPYCCMFIYCCIKAYFPDIKNTAKAYFQLQLFSLVLLAAVAFVWPRMYSSYTFFLLGIAIVLVGHFRKRLRFFHTNYFVISYAVILIPFLIVNGFLTAIPVVLYNNAENLNFRIWTIPFEDAFYGMLLVLLNVLCFEYLRARNSSKKIPTV
jgi:lycopene cyclase domain-containing protein